MRWTDEMRAFMAEFVPGHSDRETAEAFEARFGVALTRSQVKNAKQRLCLRSGTVGGRFERGGEPWNKGLPRDEWGLSEEAMAAVRRGQFGKGHVPHNTRPMGSERVDKDGYVLVKVAEGRACNYRLKHVVEYEKANGPVPEGCSVRFADGDRRNFDPANLVAVPRRVSPAVNRMGARPCGREGLEAAVAVAEVESAARAALLGVEVGCRACGRPFRREHERQRRCRECIDAGRKARC